MSGSEGEVTYEVRADDGQVEKDLEKANKKVEKAVKRSADDTVKVEEQKSKKIKKESDKTVQSAEKAADDVAGAWKEAGKDAEKAMDIDIKGKTIDVDADTGKAETKIKNVSKDKSIDVDVNADNSDAKESIEDLEDVADDVGEKIEDSLSGAFGNIGKFAKSSFSNAASSTIPFLGNIGALTKGLSGASVAALGIGATAVGTGALAVNAANDMSAAMNGFLAETGKSREEMERYQGVLEDVYANNYGDSFEDIAGAMAQIAKNLGDMDDSALQNVTESAFALRDTFEYDIQESTRAAKAMMDNFGTSGEEAMNLIASGAQNGLDFSGELLDSINEYSVHFQKLGLYADDMFQIFQAGTDSGAFNLDKIGDAVKELSIRVIDGSETTKEGFETLGLNADEMSAKFAAGGNSAKEAFKQTVQALASIEDPLEQDAAGVALFGTMWEDLGADAVTALADIEDGAYATGEELDNIKDIKYDDIGSQLEELKRNVELLVIPLGESLMPILSSLIEDILPVVIDLLTPLISIFSALIVPIVELVGSAISPLIEAFDQLVNVAIMPLIGVLQGILEPIFSGVLSSLMTSASGVIGNIVAVFKNLIDFIKNVFTGNWSGAWNNVKNIFKGAVDALVGIFKAPINAIVDGWNSLSNSLGSISIPKWVPAVGGKSFSLPTLPRLRIGMDYVPSDDFPALLHKGEAVLTAKENARLRALGGLDGIERLLSSGNNVEFNVAGAQSGLDKDLIRAMLRLAKLADRPVAAYFNVDSRTMSKTLCKPMQTEIYNDQQLKNMINGEKR